MTLTHETTDQAWLGLEGRRVLVIGNGGFGREAAMAYASAGATVAVADLDTSGFDDLPPTISTIQADLSDPRECEDVVTEAVRRLGGLDVFFHAIGVNRRKPIFEISDDEWRTIVDVNLSSAFWLGRSAGRQMVAAGYGRMVFCSSVSGLLAHPEHGPYAASKGGLNQLIRVMAREWAPHGVTVNAVAPGYAETPLTAAHLDRPGVRESYTSLVPMGRLGRPGDVVGPVLYLSSQQCGYVTGQVLYVDGGRTLV